ncbi:MAG: ATP:cob(I)alamin adenosyltransferase, partial [Treponema sp.]|nr:ATP:cob(I)alamin adenosyltransferase [Treponema sp.]
AFAVPGANPASAKLHIARAVCRRAERRLITLERESMAVAYINRLSDLLFLLAQIQENGENKKNLTRRSQRRRVKRVISLLRFFLCASAPLREIF